MKVVVAQTLQIAQKIGDSEVTDRSLLALIVEIAREGKDVDSTMSPAVTTMETKIKKNKKTSPKK